MSTEIRVRRVLEEVIPKGKPFRIVWHRTGVGQYHVLRVVTPAWRSLPRFKRILKVQEAIRTRLIASERKNILRVSVLTSEEFRRLRLASPRTGGAARQPRNGK